MTTGCRVEAMKRSLICALTSVSPATCMQQHERSAHVAAAPAAPAAPTPTPVSNGARRGRWPGWGAAWNKQSARWWRRTPRVALHGDC